MSSIGLSGISGISENTLQFRYEKALKQINKLIEINRQLKESSNGRDGQVEKLMEQIQKLQQANRQLDEENNILESKYMELENHYHQLQAYCKELTEKFQINQVEHQDSGNKIHLMEAKFQEELENQTVKYNELVREAEFINQAYQENLETLEHNSQRIAQLEAENKELMLRNAQLTQENAQLSALAKDKNIGQIQSQLEQANQTIEKLIKQCNQLKNKQIDLEVQDEKKRVQKFIGYSVVQDPRQNQQVKQLLHEYKKKIKTLQTDKKQLQHKYKKLKTHSNLVVPEEFYHKKIEGLERLTQKQQAELTRIIETYDKELTNLSRENAKLREGFYSLSQKLTKKSMDLDEKEQIITQLKFTTDRVFFENQSLKKANSSLIEMNADRLKDLHHLGKDMPHAESFTIFDKKISEEMVLEQQSNINIKKKSNETTKQTFAAQHKTCNSAMQPKSTPITVNYRSPVNEDRDFRFIQSVSIINGYNVSLGEHNTHKTRHG